MISVQAAPVRTAVKCVLALSLNRREDQRPIPGEGILLDPAAVHIALTGRWVTSQLSAGRAWPTSRKRRINLRL